MNKIEANKHSPLWKIEMSEFVYGKDSGNPYDDPENDIRNGSIIRYYSKQNVDCDWLLEYDEPMGDFSRGLHQAALTLERLKELHDIKPDENTVMFEYQGKMFKEPYWIENQKCICGESIDDFYNDYEDDRSVKVDMIRSYIFYYEKDCLVIKFGRLYLNGEMVMTKEELEEKYGIKYYQAQSMYPETVRKKMAELFPQAIQYNSWSTSGYFNREKPELSSQVACVHKKVYSNMLLTIYPPKHEWICEKCGERGCDTEQSPSNGYETLLKYI